MRLDRLTESQADMLERLDDGPHEDSVGIEVLALSRAELGVCDELYERKLVDLHPGWRLSFWFRLTAEGRRVLERTRNPVPAPARRPAR